MIQFVNGNGIVFIDNRNYPFFKQNFKCIENVLPGNREGQHIAGQQNLGHLRLIVQKPLGIDPHQFHLTNCCQGLLFGDFLGPLGQL